MLVADIMTKDVATVGPSAAVLEIAKLLLERRISAVPVVDENGVPLGIVSEGDLLRRPEIGTETRRSWWLELLTVAEEQQSEFVKEHGRVAEHVMNRRLVTTTEDASLAEVAEILERNHIKRLPVVRDGKIVGIVSRANILQGLATATPANEKRDRRGDRVISEDVMRTLSEDARLSASQVDVVVEDGVVQLWGAIDTESGLQAALLAAESVADVRKVESRIMRVPPWAYGY